MRKGVWGGVVLSAVVLAATTVSAFSWSDSRRYVAGPSGDVGIILHKYVSVATEEWGLEAEVNVGGVIWDGCRSNHHARNGGHPNRDLPCATTAPDDLWLSLTDDVYLSDQGGFVCTDVDGDGNCGDPFMAETMVAFCAAISMPRTWGFDTNNLWALVLYVDGPFFQGFDCPGSANPTGGTAGTAFLSLNVF